MTVFRARGRSRGGDARDARCWVTVRDCGAGRRRRSLLRRWGLVPLALLIVLGFHGPSADAAERTGPVKIGALTQSWGPTPQTFALREGLLALGYREGEQFVIGVRFTQGDTTGLLAAAQDLIRDGVDILFANDANSAKAAQLATTRIPIVFAAGAGDPVELGLIQSFARPGGNITGVTDTDIELSAKRLEIFKEMIPGLRRVVFPYDSGDAYAVAAARAYRDAARQLGVVLVEKPVRTQEEARVTLSALRKAEVDGILVPSTLSLNLPGFAVDATSQRAIPTMFNGSFYVELGGLASYGPNAFETGRLAARLVDKILKGEDPGRIPVEANSKIELAINVKAVKTLKLPIPPSVLQRATRLIE